MDVHCSSLVFGRRWAWYFCPVRAVVRKQLILLGLGMGAAILSMILGSLATWALHVSGELIFVTAFGTFMLLLVKVRPDFFRLPRPSPRKRGRQTYPLVADRPVVAV